MNPKCNLIIDSCCDLPYAEVERPGVSILHFPYFFGEEEHFDDLFKNVSAHDFYERMRNGEQPHTAQLSLAQLDAAFTEAAESGVPTVYLSFASGMSGSFDLAQTVMAQVLERYPEAELYCVDTRMASAGEGLVIYEAMHQREQGLTARELAAWADQAANFANVYFLVDDLESLRRGGRIPNSVAFAGAKLDVKPVLYIAADGTLQIKSIARGRKKAIKMLVDMYVQRRRSDEPVECVLCTNADCPKDAERLHEMLVKQCGEVPFLQGWTGPVIGSHVGPGMMALAFWGQDRREDLSVSDRIARKVKGGEQ
jgi:DegV family protein with EDD domain